MRFGLIQKHRKIRHREKHRVTAIGAFLREAEKIQKKFASQSVHAQRSLPGGNYLTFEYLLDTYDPSDYICTRKVTE
ncbi:MAG TPA: hypothetical protein DEW31_06265 [Alistipes obesi]|nr:hypothetical protein [Alistipes communis]